MIRGSDRSPKGVEMRRTNVLQEIRIMRFGTKLGKLIRDAGSEAD